METMFMQNFGGTNKEYYGIFESGLLKAKVRYDNQVFILQENSVVAAHELLGNL